MLIDVADSSMHELFIVLLIFYEVSKATDSLS